MEPYRGGPESTRLSLVVDLVVLVCIVSSIALILLEHLYPARADLIWQIELGFTVIFVIEYLLRWYAAPNRLMFPVTFAALIDLVAILPTLLVLGAEMMMLRAVRGLRLLRLLRLLRVVRLLKALRYGYLIARGLVNLRIWFGTVVYQYRVRQLANLFLYLLVAWFIGANLVHLTELQLAGAESPYATYWRSYWNIVIVLISGIEDKEPVSLLGRIEVTGLLIVGICMVGMLTGEIVSILVRRIQRSGRIALKPPVEVFEDHIVILGSNPHLDRVIRQLVAALHGRYFVLVVSPDAENLRTSDQAIYRNVFTLVGDPADSRVLEQADIDRAQRVIVLAGTKGSDAPEQVDNRTLMRVLAVVGRRRPVPIVAELLSQETVRYARSLSASKHGACVDFILARQIGEKLMVQAALKPELTELLAQLMTFTDDTNEFYTVPVLPELVGKSFREAQLHYLDRDDKAELPVGIDRSPPAQPKTRFWLNPVAGQRGLTAEGLVLGENDQLVFLAYQLPSYDRRRQQDDLWSGAVLQRG